MVTKSSEYRVSKNRCKGPSSLAVLTAVTRPEEGNPTEKGIHMGTVLPETPSFPVHHDGTSALYEALSSGGPWGCR